MKIRRQKRQALLLLPCLLLLLTGCRGIGTQRFTAFAPSQAQELARFSRTVLDVRCVQVMGRADYSLCENLHMLAPIPKRTKLDVTLQVQQVLKGEFVGERLQLHWLRSPSKQQSGTLRIPYRGGFDFGFTNGMQLRIGFGSHSGQSFEDLKIIIRHD
ncbi:MAG: hypothetical protein JWM16_2960 [Verrucomicrobiales bacterium]|nr:hypothetical protein [Verrucomicrobiales bacterium]